MKRAKTIAKTKELSQNYGINYESFLLKINFFDVCKCLLQDPMHILYEGICHDELKCLFEYLIKIKKVFNFDQLNDRIKSFDYFKSDKPIFQMRLVMSIFIQGHLHKRRVK
jgi:hypothetical protein